MNTAFTVAAIVLMVALVPLALVALRATPINGLVAVELAGVLTTLTLVCLAVGTQSGSATGVALVTAVLTWASGPLYARFMDRQP